MRKLATLLAVLGLAAMAATAWLVAAPRPALSAAQPSGLDEGGDAGRGRLVFSAADCGSCHASPGQSDRLRLGGGLALASPFGTFRAPNISPDRRDGIGGWSTVDLANALLSGVSPDGRHYYPALPYTSYARMTLGDIGDLMAYLRTLPPVAGRPPPHELALPFQIRRGVGLWKLLYFDPRPILDDPAHDASWNRGRYLVEAVSHCAECHSSRNVFGAIRPDARFAGARDPEGLGFVPNITPDRIGHWSQAEVAEMLRSGHTPELRFVGSSMADVVTNTAALPQEDRDAIAAYVKSLPARRTATP